MPDTFYVEGEPLDRARFSSPPVLAAGLRNRYAHDNVFNPLRMQEMLF